MQVVCRGLLLAHGGLSLERCLPVATPFKLRLQMLTDIVLRTINSSMGRPQARQLQQQQQQSVYHRCGAVEDEDGHRGW